MTSYFPMLRCEARAMGGSAQKRANRREKQNYLSTLHSFRKSVTPNVSAQLRSARSKGRMLRAHIGGAQYWCGHIMQIGRVSTSVNDVFRMRCICDALTLTMAIYCFEVCCCDQKQ